MTAPDSPRLCRCGQAKEAYVHLSHHYDPAPLVRGPGASALTCGCGVVVPHRPDDPCPAPVGEPAAAAPRCEGRYPVPGPRTEGFPVTYRCGLIAGHPGEHAAEAPAPPLIRDHVPPEPAVGCSECDDAENVLRTEEARRVSSDPSGSGAVPRAVVVPAAKEPIEPALITDHAPVHRTGDGGECQHVSKCLMPDEAHERREP